MRYVPFSMFAPEQTALPRPHWSSFRVRAHARFTISDSYASILFLRGVPPRAPQLKAPEHAHTKRILRDHRGPWVESTTGAVAGRHDPIYTRSVSSRRSANRTCGFPASGSLRDHAFAHGGSRVGTDGRTRRNDTLGARKFLCGESPIRCFRHNHRRGRRAPARRWCADDCRVRAALPPVRRCMLDFLLRFRMQCLAQLLDRCRRCQTHSSIACRPLLPAPFPDQGSFPPPALPGFTGTTTLSATPRGRFRASRHDRWPAPPRQPPRGASRVAHDPSTHMPSPLPRRNRWVRMSLSFPNGGGLPRISGGSASALPFSRPARRSLRVTACALAESLRTLLHRKLRLLRCLHRRSDCYRLERPLPGGNCTHWDRAPLHGTLRHAG